MSTSPPSARKKPHCHACGLPMAGHKRPDGLPLCPVKEESLTPPPSYASPPPPTSFSSLFSGSLSSLASPPATPPRQPSHAPTTQPLITNPSPSPKRPEPSFAIPDSGPWHRRNPNWVDRPAPRPPTPAGSYVSTVLVDDDGKTIRGPASADEEEEYDDDDDDGASVTSSFIAGVAATLKHRRVVSMFATRRTDPARTQQLAARNGVHAALVRGKKGSGLGSWLMVLGRDPGAVGRVMVGGSQWQWQSQRGMPGGVEDLPMEGPQLTTFLQLVLAGLIGGIFTVVGMSFM